jgi:hypothetical protein
LFTPNNVGAAEEKKPEPLGAIAVMVTGERPGLEPGSSTGSWPGLSNQSQALRKPVACGPYTSLCWVNVIGPYGFGAPYGFEKFGTGAQGGGGC